MGQSDQPARERSTGEPAARQSFRAELRDAISVRTVLLVPGVLVLQLGFILSYVGAFHSPKPHRIPLAVSSPAGLPVQRVVDQLNAIPAGRWPPRC